MDFEKVKNNVILDIYNHLLVLIVVLLAMPIVLNASFWKVEMIVAAL